MNESGTPTGGHAVVIGGSVAGLLAARALNASFEQVTVLDRDTLPADPVARRGVPQGRHVHGLTARGAAGLNSLFPGFLDALTAAGAPRADALADYNYYLDGHKLARAIADTPNYLATRPLIESLIRERTSALGNVTVADSTEVVDLIAAEGRVTGVRVRPVNDEQAGHILDADLVVDAAGRGSRVMTWLAALGYPAPEETVVRTNVVYVTRHFRQEPGQPGGRQAVVSGAYPANPRSGAAVRQENGRIAVFLAGMLGDEPPTDDEGMRAFAATLAAPEIAELLGTAEPLGEAAKMRNPASSLRHFEKLDRYLDGYLVVGDAMCNFNPLYGQGITVAVLEAELLESLLRDGTDRLARRYFAGSARLLAEPWALATGSDLRFPGVEGVRNPEDEQAGQYLSMLRTAAATDVGVAAAFLRVANMLAPISSLFDPALAARVQKSAPQHAPG
ncbi:FAD-binding monooxygenase [Actinoplanes italicus]|uniref:Flavin-dependent dehydrogenase n=1 Tax=Actinoplanes italicus TaxID=113567 RepID=A0A2T0K790_9ACTN|nr:FAD-dependent monooxygenase [Actinoplanes italicus]PRX18890.1 flavin-dependent dehydrogenase [Actinoplanes italicus]GIE32533.1 FAD-binding monooxygenase [Actinoplanes italicus]